MNNLLKLLKNNIYTFRHCVIYFSNKNNNYTYQEKSSSFSSKSKHVIHSPEYFVKILNKFYSKNYFVYFYLSLLVFSISVFFKLFHFSKSSSFNYLLLIIFILLSLLLVIKKFNSIIYLQYKFNNSCATFYTKLTENLSLLNNSKLLNQVVSKNKNSNLKYKAGSKLIYNRYIAKINNNLPNHLKSNIKIWNLKIKDCCLYFFPDFILLFYSQKYYAIKYNTLDVKYFETPYVDCNHTPGDAKFINFTWKYLNKNGKPDKRFKKNKKVPKYLYSEISIKILNFLTIELQASNLKFSHNFAKHLGTLANSYTEKFYYDKKEKKSFTSSKNKNSNYNDSNYYDNNTIKQKKKNNSAYKILGVNNTATKDEIKSAYRKLVKLYHPDKHVKKNKKDIHIAEQKIKEIISAYNETIK